jgi:hypothetical protein
MSTGKKKTEYKTSNNNGCIPELLKELWQAVNLRGSIEPADYKRYVAPIIFLRFYDISKKLLTNLSRFLVHELG